MLQQPWLLMVTIVGMGYALMLLAAVCGIAVLAWDGRQLRHPSTARALHRREYAESLAGSLVRLVSGTLTVVTAGVALAALAWWMT